LGNALALLLGKAASVLTAWQQAVVAGVFELCLVGVMVIYELLGQQKAVQVSAETGSADTINAQPEQRSASQSVAKRALPARPKFRANATKNGSGRVNSFIRDQVFPADGSRVEMKALMRDYRAWCTQNDVAPIDLNRFLDEIEKVCSKLGIEIEVGSDQRVYCLNVKIESVMATAAH
jgi:hypothetical protein